MTKYPFELQRDYAFIGILLYAGNRRMHDPKLANTAPAF